MCKPEEIIKSCDVTNYIISKLGHSPNGMKSTKYAVIGILSQFKTQNLSMVIGIF
jgi:hypothetical protein